MTARHPLPPEVVAALEAALARQAEVEALMSAPGAYLEVDALGLAERTPPPPIRAGPPPIRTLPAAHAARARRAQQLRAAGWSLRAIAAEVGASVTAVRKDLERDP